MDGRWGSCFESPRFVWPCVMRGPVIVSVGRSELIDFESATRTRLRLLVCVGVKKTN